MAKFISNNQTWDEFALAASNLIWSINSFSLFYDQIKKIEEAEDYIYEKGLDNLYSAPSKKYAVTDLDNISLTLQGLYDSFYGDFHSKGVGDVDSVATEKLTNAIEKLNKVNGEKTKYTSSHVDTEVTESVAVQTGSSTMNVVNQTTSRPITLDEMMLLNDGPLKKIGDKYRDILEANKEKALSNKEISQEEIDAINSLDVRDMLGYNIINDYTKVKSDHATRMQWLEIALDVGLGIATFFPPVGTAIGVSYFVGKAVIGNVTGKNPFTGETLSNSDRIWLIIDAVGSLAIAGSKIISTISKTGNIAYTINKTCKAVMVGVDVVEMGAGGIAGIEALIRGDLPAAFLMLGIAALGAKGIKGDVSALNKLDALEDILDAKTLTNISKLDNSILSKIDVDALKKMDPDLLSKINPKILNNLNPKVVNSLSLEEIVDLDWDALAKLDRKVLKSLDAEGLKKIGNKDKTSFDDWINNMPYEDRVRYLQRLDLLEGNPIDYIDGVRVIDGKVGGKIPIDEYIRLREASIHNSFGDSLVLGKFKDENNINYIEVGKDNGNTFFDFGEDWSAIKDKYDLSEDDMFNYFNKPAIDDALFSGKEIKFSHDPRLKIYDDSTLRTEWNYLMNVHDFDEVVEEGGGWIATKK